MNSNDVTVVGTRESSISIFREKHCHLKRNRQPRQSMSLVQHVSAAEGTDREPVEPDTASLALGRRLSLTLSYDPIPGGAQPSEKLLKPVGAYEVSRNKRIGIVCFDLTIALKMSNVVDSLRSAGCGRRCFVCVGVWDCFRICRAQGRACR